MQIPIPQLVRLDREETSSIIPNSHDVGIWQDFLSLQIKETTQRAYSKSLADFCLKVYPALSISDALQSFLLLSQSDALHQAIRFG
jgi:hypothetical protein